MLAVLFYILLGYLLFRFVFGFLIPIIRTTRQVKRSFREMNQRMQDAYGGTNAAPGATSVPPATKAPSKDDYIDFEEIKE
ncbi:MAG: hypothetical protein EOO16_09635 [Chitinophagaceae bacterium]|nr:MAG: hypothetical protein EOO16_09635 [Chitinophagaceae bacterium]